MISHLTTKDDHHAVLDQVVRALAAGPTLAFGWTERALTAGTLGDLEEAQTIEAAGQRELVRTADFREGARALRERRSPEFRGR